MTIRIVEIPRDPIKYKVDASHVLYDEAWLDGTEATLFVDPNWFHPRREAKLYGKNTNMLSGYGLPAGHEKRIRALALLVREGCVDGKITAEFWYCSSLAYVFEFEGLGGGVLTRAVPDATCVLRRPDFTGRRAREPNEEIEVLSLEAWSVVLKYDTQPAPVRVRVNLNGPLRTPDWGEPE